MWLAILSQTETINPTKWQVPAYFQEKIPPPPPTSREELLTGLKKNWEVLHHQYQGLSVVTDTAPKKARKERMEAEMKQLEKDIELIERHKVILVSQPEVVH